jgi:hypothetical protein
MATLFSAPARSDFPALRSDPIRIWSLLMAAVIALFWSSGSVVTQFLATFANSYVMALARGGRAVGNPDAVRFMGYMGVASSLAFRAALLVALLYLLRFFRYHLLPSIFPRRSAGPTPPTPPPAPRPAEGRAPAPNFTLTGEQTRIEAEEDPPAPEESWPGDLEANADPARLLERAMIAIATGVGIQVAAEAAVLLGALMV